MLFIHLDPLYINKILFTKLDKVTSVEFPIEQLDIYVGAKFIHFDNDELYCNN